MMRAGRSALEWIGPPGALSALTEAFMVHCSGQEGVGNDPYLRADQAHCHTQRPFLWREEPLPAWLPCPGRNAENSDIDLLVD
jgi:hypothetical protein